MEHEQVAAALHARDPSAVSFGIDLVESSTERTVVRMRVPPDLANGLEMAHGGIAFVLADSAMAFASNAGNEAALATSAEIDWLAPTPIGAVLTATAVPRAASGRSAVWDVTVVAEHDGETTTVALFRGRTRRVGRPVVDVTVDATVDANAAQANSEPR